VIKAKYEKVKQHVQENKTTYLIVIGGVAVATGTCLLMRDILPQPISRDIVVTASRDTVVAGKKVVMKNVSYISADRQGPPSWVVRCKETGSIFTSQNSAAIEMGLSSSHLSSHLNGMRDHVDGYHFERICMAA
jgi:hypothetical protein